MLRADGDAGAEVVGTDAGCGAGNVVDAFEHAAEPEKSQQEAEGHHEDPAEEEAEEELAEEMFCAAIEEAEVDASGAWGDVDGDDAERLGKAGDAEADGLVLRDLQGTQECEEGGAVPWPDPQRGIGVVANLGEEDGVAAGVLTVVPGKLLGGELGDFFNDAVVESVARCAEGNLAEGFAFPGEPGVAAFANRARDDEVHGEKDGGAAGGEDEGGAQGQAPGCSAIEGASKSGEHGLFAE